MSQNRVVIFGFVDNLMFSTRIESVVESFGFIMEWTQQGDRDLILGSENPLLGRITRLAPALILIDLGIAGIPWDWLIQQVKSNPTTNHTPVICFGSHMDAATLKMARQAGADEVVARSRFFSALPELIQKYFPERHERTDK